jgi:hypothetical protein
MIWKAAKKIGKKVGKAISKGVKKIGKVTGIGKVFKKVGKWVKGAFKSFGKFMGKIGILGQVAMMFVLPGIGGALMKGLGAIGQAAAASSNVFLQGVTKVATFVQKSITTVGNVFKNITAGVTETLGNFGKAVGNKLGLTKTAPTELFSSRFTNLTADPASFAEKVSAAADQVNKAFDGVSNVTEIGPKVVGEPSLVTGSQSKVASFADKVSGFTDVQQSSLLDSSRVVLDAGPKKGFFSTLGAAASESIKEIPDKIIEGVTEAPEKIKDYLVNKPTEILDKGLDVAVMTGVQSKILGDDYMAPQVTEGDVTQYSSYVPSVDYNVPPVDSFGASPIMDARAFETNVLQSPMPYGNTAYQYERNYNNYFSQFA